MPPLVTRTWDAVRRAANTTTARIVVAVALIVAGVTLALAFQQLRSDTAPLVDNTLQTCAQAPGSVGRVDAEQSGKCRQAADAASNPLVGQVGKVGPPGTPGAPGAPGTEGGSGPPGPPGVGTPGTNGAPGVPGAPGAPGRPGVGTPGTNGSNGTNGTNGAPGTPGATGDRGPTGATGPTGPGGPAGPEGPPGTPGTDGTNGADGSPAKTITLSGLDGQAYACTRSGGTDTAPRYACDPDGG